MGKAKELLGLIASITEEGEGQGPLNLMAGAKVKFVQGESEVVGEVTAMEDGSVYDQAADAYAVKVGDQVMMVKSSDLSMAETKAARQRPGKPNPYKKTLKQESAEGEPGPVDGPAAPAEDVLAKMGEDCEMVKGVLSEMDGLCDGDMCPATKGIIQEMMLKADDIMPQYESELSIPDADGGGAGDGGNQQDDGGNGTPA